MTKFLSAAAVVLVATGAIAATPAPVRATLAAPSAAPRVDIGTATWSCVGTACTGPASNARLGDARACRDLAKMAGTIASYTGAKGELSADDLAKCNKAAKTA